MVTLVSFKRKPCLEIIHEKKIVLKHPNQLQKSIERQDYMTSEFLKRYIFNLTIDITWITGQPV